MCQKCLDAINKYLPDLSHQEAMEVLWSQTAFPFGGPEQIERQLAEFQARCAIRRILLSGENAD